MKSTLRIIEEWTGHKCPGTGPWKGLGYLALLAAVLAIGFAMCGCATLESIPFSVSYQDDQGETFTLTKLAVPQIHPSK